MAPEQGSVSVGDRMVSLIGIMNRECLLLEHLVFKLHEAELLSDAGHVRFMAMMSDEIDEAATELGEAEVTRALLTADLTRKLGIDDGATLAEIAGHAPEEASSTLLTARERMKALTEAVERAAADATGSVTHRLTESDAAIARLEGTVPQAPGYGADGSADLGGSVSRFQRDL